MSKATEAVVVLCKCTQSHRAFGIRAEKTARKHWEFTWAFPVKEEAAHREGYDRTTVDGNVDFSEEYPGCPYCGDTGFVLCPQCNKLCCGFEADRITPCEWCGFVASGLSEYSGEVIRAGMDL